MPRIHGDMNMEIHNSSALPQQIAGALQEAGPVRTEGGKSLQGNDRGLTVSNAQQPAAVDAVPDSALDRADALGKLVSAAFNLPAPPYPAELA